MYFKEILDLNDLFKEKGVLLGLVTKNKKIIWLTSFPSTGL